VLDRALGDAEVDRKAVFVTNAVKHFKHEMRGKRRLHKKPNAGEIERCRWWLDNERALLKPAVIIAMGATAVRGVLGRAATIKSLRGKTLALDDGSTGLVTIHPSALLRMDDDEEKEAAYRAFVADLRRAAQLAKGDT
jgi:DNA polymerase